MKNNYFEKELWFKYAIRKNFSLYAILLVIIILVFSPPASCSVISPPISIYRIHGTKDLSDSRQIKGTHGTSIKIPDGIGTDKGMEYYFQSGKTERYDLKKIAVIISEYRPGSHADAIVTKLFEGYFYGGKRYKPGVQVVSMYTDQVPDEDMSRDFAAKYHFKLLPSVREALTLTSNSSSGGRKLAVDGVMLICEHGSYPYNEIGQKLYPRFELFKQIIDVFRETGQTVPIFTDKHLSYEWFKAKWMYDQSFNLRFPLMAGSSLPFVLAPEQKFELGTPFEKAVWTWSADFIGNKDSYGFHALEQLECRVERREGGETGIKAVQCFEGTSVWEWTDENPWANRLLEASVRGPIGTISFNRENIKDPMLFVLEYNSGLQAAIYRINGQKSAESFASYIRGKSEPVFDPKPVGILSPVAVPDSLRSRYRYNNFSAQIYYFEQMLLTNNPPNPVERTLLTTGTLAALCESSYLPDASMYGKSNQHGKYLPKGRRIITSHLSISYRLPK